MYKRLPLTLFFGVILMVTLFSFKERDDDASYTALYREHIQQLHTSITIWEKAAVSEATHAQQQELIRIARLKMKRADFWLRYLNPIDQKKINGPLAVEWETEVFEKHEPPYKREGFGLYLAYEAENNEELLRHAQKAGMSTQLFLHDSITQQLTSFDHFYYCNRLFLLNLATIYTTGFECPNPEWILPELRELLNGTYKIYTAFNQQYSEQALPAAYLKRYAEMIRFVEAEKSYDSFHHYTFIRDYVNPLFAINQQLLQQYRAVSKNLLDYSLNKKATSIFSKNLYLAQHTKGIFYRITNDSILSLIAQMGESLFYDPLLSGNTKRSCASCHKASQYFADTSWGNSLSFDGINRLERNTPTLLNIAYNHLLMSDGKHITLSQQLKGVLHSPSEMNCSDSLILKRVLSCSTYKDVFHQLVSLTPHEPELTIDHIASAITYYVGLQSAKSAAFDAAMNQQQYAHNAVVRGFNLFMGKAQCGTCHFAPHFNGVKPPYTNSEFEVLGVPEDPLYSKLSNDKGRALVFSEQETQHAFRTPTLKNIVHTSPYMHNGVFKTLEEVIDFYNLGGGSGHGLHVPNQTLSSDSLHLTAQEKQDLIAFMQSLSEALPEKPQLKKLPTSNLSNLNQRNIGGTY